MKSRYKIINLMIMAILILIVLLYYMFSKQISNNNMMNSYVSYSVDFNILEQYEINNQFYINIEILSDRFIEDYKLESPLITLKVDSQILNDIEFGQIGHYMGLLVKVEIENEESSQKLCSLNEQNSLFVISYPDCYQQIEVIGLFSYD
ncbi:hypothetical protein [Turicibacter sanguinis]|uniref:hypothetical protein n=1 Tax=Turicibacter sanguinis TaxID=154288 RepID=UPI0006C10B12|nr:hypothetical protein [Turicibacter sanguinis]MDB8576505.1 hypothetical protein [Turicibacter sanguinis]MDB8579498.1 hypothetical protein [Turicibacter sanguinis]MDB8585237.1 hypothetical protein [Turicibacter sanguinis]MDB8588213.1 hypothetical protein [Turicibacter sanguinis]MDB8599047.1 hypothetical protein [Turicibacter sanguinis]